MIRKCILFLIAIFMTGIFSLSVNAALLICQKGQCDYTMNNVALKPWIRQLHKFFKTPNTRIDFCEATPNNRACKGMGLKWLAGSNTMEVHFTIPVARTIPQKHTLLMDYLVTANESLPSCSFSNSTFEPADNGTIRFVSNAFECKLNDLGRTKLQNTFFVDYIDFDNSIIGAQYTIQTHGEIRGTSTGYTLMKFRDGNTLKPLVFQPDYGEIAPAPDAQTAKQIARRQQALQAPAEEKDSDFVSGVKDWWQRLKESFNLDRPKTASHTAYEEPSWWDSFSEKFMKVIYLEPLE